jgi:hypothetical protein
MPVVVQTREYDEQFYRSVSLIQGHEIKTLVKELF